MNFERVLVSWNRQKIISGYCGDYMVKDGPLLIESWIAEILVKHGYAMPLEHNQALLFSHSPREGYGLSLNPGKEAESYERRNKKHNGKGKAGHREIIREGGELNVKLDNSSILQ